MSTTGLVAESVSLTGSALAQFCRSTAGYAKYTAASSQELLAMIL